MALRDGRSAWCWRRQLVGRGAEAGWRRRARSWLVVGEAEGEGRPEVTGVEAVGGVRSGGVREWWMDGGVEEWWKEWMEGMDGEKWKGRKGRNGREWNGNGGRTARVERLVRVAAGAPGVAMVSVGRLTRSDRRRGWTVSRLKSAGHRAWRSPAGVRQLGQYTTAATGPCLNNLRVRGRRCRVSPPAVSICRSAG